MTSCQDTAVNHVCSNRHGIGGDHQVSLLKVGLRVAGNFFQPIAADFGCMQDPDIECRGKLHGFATPVADQRRRHDQQRWPGLPGPKPQQQGKDLDGLAESHVVGETGAKTEPGQEVQPVTTIPLIRAQLSLEVHVVSAAICTARLTQSVQDLLEGGTGGDVGPVPVFLAPFVFVQIGRRPGEQPHALDEGYSALGICLLLQFFPVRQRLLQFLAIDLDPPTLEIDQAILTIEQACSSSSVSVSSSSATRASKSSMASVPTPPGCAPPILTATRGRDRFCHQLGIRTVRPQSSSCSTLLRNW